MEIKNLNPLKAIVEFDFEKKCICITDELGIVNHSISLFEEYIDYIKELYEIYVLDDEAKLSEGAKKLRENLLEKVVIE